jgi:hypothetical protein
MARSASRKRHRLGRLAPPNLARTARAKDDVRMTLVAERRKNRSDDPLVALHYQLAHCRHEGRLEAIVVADDAGVVVAGAGAWATCEELAAYAPLLAQGVWTEPGCASSSRVAELRTEVDVQSVEIDGQQVLVCARGGWMRATAMERATAGIVRILRRAA